MSRDSYLRRTYGITEDQYNFLLEKQGGGCAICGKTKEQEGKHLAVDHDHHTLKIRGILCSYDNKYVVGRHRDANLLRRVADYLETESGFIAPSNKKRSRRRKKKVVKTNTCGIDVS